MEVEEDNPGLSNEQEAGIIIGSLLLLISLGVLFHFCCCRNRGKSEWIVTGSLSPGQLSDGLLVTEGGPAPAPQDQWDQDQQEHAVREQAMREQALREQTAREQAAREQLQREQEEAARLEAARREEVRRAEEAARQEAIRHAVEVARQAEVARQEAIRRQAEAARRQAEAARQEAARQEAMRRQAEEEARRQAELARQIAEARRQEAARQAAEEARQEALRHHAEEEAQREAERQQQAIRDQAARRTWPYGARVAGRGRGLHGRTEDVYAQSSRASYDGSRYSLTHQEYCMTSDPVTSTSRPFANRNDTWNQASSSAGGRAPGNPHTTAGHMIREFQDTLRNRYSTLEEVEYVNSALPRWVEWFDRQAFWMEGNRPTGWENRVAELDRIVEELHELDDRALQEGAAGMNGPALYALLERALRALEGI